MMIRPKGRKFAELILFISERSEGDARFSTGKLNRLLFYSDFGAYLQLGNSITGEAYLKLPEGPSAHRFVEIRDKLVARGELAIRQHERGCRNQDRTFALRSANVTDFTPDEIALVTKLVDQSWEYDAEFKGYYSNDSAHWEEDVPDFNKIPYEFALLSKRRPTKKERELCEKDVHRARAFFAIKREPAPSDA